MADEARRTRAMRRVATAAAASAAEASNVVRRALRSGTNVALDAILGRCTTGAFDAARGVPAEAILRAAEAARWAPNHKLSEPFTLRWLSDATRARVCDLHEETLRAAGKGAKTIERKMRRWREIPEMVAVTVATEEPRQVDGAVAERKDGDDGGDALGATAGEEAFRGACGPLRAHEDRMCAAAATQNFLVSLAGEAEPISSKWSTGAVTRTQAFAEACGYDLRREVCIALLHVGYAEEGSAPRPRLRRREVDGNLLRRV